MINRAQSLSKPKVTTKSTEGKAETRHFIISPDLPLLPPWGEGYKTQAEARAALPKTQAEARAALPNTHDASRGEVSRWEIISITRREDGSPLVTHEVDLRGSTKNTKYLVTVGVQELVSPAKPTGEYGWLFYGIAAE